MTCKLCNYMNRNCPDHETTEERAERKAIWMARATAHIDTPRIRREAEAKWAKANLPNNGERNTKGSSRKIYV